MTPIWAKWWIEWWWRLWSQWGGHQWEGHQQEEHWQRGHWWGGQSESWTWKRGTYAQSKQFTINYLPSNKVKGKGKGKGTNRKIVLRALCKDIDKKREWLCTEEEEKGAMDRGEARWGHFTIYGNAIYGNFWNGFLVFDASLSVSASHPKTLSRRNITRPVQTQLPWATSPLNPSLVVWMTNNVWPHIQLHSVQSVPRLCPLSHLACNIIATGGTTCVLRSDQAFVLTWGFFEWCQFCAFCSCHCWNVIST